MSLRSPRSSQTQYRGQAEESKESCSQVPPVIQVTLIPTSKQTESQDREDEHEDEEQGQHGGHSVDRLPHSGDERLQGRRPWLG